MHTHSKFLYRLLDVFPADQNWTFVRISSKALLSRLRRLFSVIQQVFRLFYNRFFVMEHLFFVCSYWVFQGLFHFSFVALYKLTNASISVTEQTFFRNEGMEFLLNFSFPRLKYYQHFQISLERFQPQKACSGSQALLSLTCISPHASKSCQK